MWRWKKQVVRRGASVDGSGAGTLPWVGVGTSAACTLTPMPPSSQTNLWSIHVMFLVREARPWR